MEKRRKRIRVEKTVIISDENGQRVEKEVRYIVPPEIPFVPHRKLSFSLVPFPLWKKNLRAFIPKSQWSNLRQAILDTRGERCEVCGCGEGGPFHAHEEWEYDTSGIPAIARLIGIGIQCRRCHQAEHIGLSNVFHLKGQISDEELDDIREHYCRINSLPISRMNADYQAEKARWSVYNKYPWKVDWGSYASLLGRRVAADDFNIRIEEKHDTLIATASTDYGLTPHIGLARPFGKRHERIWAVPFVQPRVTNRINSECAIMGYAFITRGLITDEMKAQGDVLIGQSYQRWTTTENDEHLLDFINR